MGKGAEYLKASGFMETSKSLMQEILRKDPALQELSKENQDRYINACLGKFLPRYEEAAGGVVEKRLPADVIVKCIEFLNSDAGRKMVYYNLLAVPEYKSVADTIMKEVVEELIAQEDAEIQKKKDQERRDRREKKSKK